MAPTFSAQQVLQDPQRVEGRFSIVSSELPPAFYRISGQRPGQDLPNFGLVSEGRDPSGQNRLDGRRPIHMLRDGSVVYLDRVANQVVHVALDGAVSTRVSKGRAAGAAAQGFWRASTFAVDESDKVYVADGWNEPERVCFGNGDPSCLHVKNPMGEGAWAGVWQMGEDGQFSRWSGVNTGDVGPDGAMNDGGPDSATYSAIEQMAFDAQGAYVLDRLRIKPLPTSGAKWTTLKLRRMDLSGAVRSVRDVGSDAWLFKDELGKVRLMIRPGEAMSDNASYRLLDPVTNAETGVHEPTRQALMNRLTQQWHSAIDDQGNTWRADVFAEPVSQYQTKDWLAISRYGPDGAYRSGVLLVNIDGRDVVQILGVSDQQQLVLMLGLRLVRVDLRELLQRWP